MPLVVDLVRPESVVDVGCGIGSWLDGLPASRRDRRVRHRRRAPRRPLPDDRPDRVQKVDLASRVTLPRRFDLALCLEVAGFISCRAGPPPRAHAHRRRPRDPVLGPDPVPGRRGRPAQPAVAASTGPVSSPSEGHVPVDCLRQDIWDLDDVAWWYKQNAMLYVHADHLRDHERLRRAHEGQPATPLPLVHPEHYLHVRAELRKGLGTRALRGAAHRVSGATCRRRSSRPSGRCAPRRRRSVEPAASSAGADGQRVTSRWVVRTAVPRERRREVSSSAMATERWRPPVQPMAMVR